MRDNLSQTDITLASNLFDVFNQMINLGGYIVRLRARLKQLYFSKSEFLPVVGGEIQQHFVRLDGKNCWKF